MKSAIQKSAAIFCALAASGIASPLQALAEDACANDPHRMNMALQLTRQGEERLAHLSYDTARQTMPELMAQIPSEFKPLGSDPEYCSKAKLAKLSPAQYNQVFADHCLGFLPDFLWYGGNPQDDDTRVQDTSKFNGRLEPVQLNMKNFSIKDFELDKNPKIVCKNNSCDVEAKVNQIKVGFDINARSVNESCALVGLNGVKLSLHRKSAAQPPATVKLHFSYENSLENPIVIDWSQSKITIPSQIIQANSDMKQAPGLCKRHELLQSVADKAAIAFVAQDQYVMNQITDAVKEQVLKGFATEQLHELAQMSGLGHDIEFKGVVPNLRQQIRVGVMSGVAKDLKKLGSDYYDALSNAKSAAEIRAIQKDKKPIEKLNSFMRGFKTIDASGSSDEAKIVHDEWSKIADQLTSLAKSTSDPEMKTLITGYAEQIRASVYYVSRFQNQITLQTRPENAADMDLIITALQAGHLQQDLQAKVSACYRCKSSNIPAGAADWGFDDGTHDGGFKTSYATINQLLAIMHSQHALNLCFDTNTEETRDCHDAGPKDGLVHISFEGAPEIFWNDATQSVAIRAKGVKLDFQNKVGMATWVGRSMKADVVLPGKLAVAEEIDEDSGNRQISFTPVEKMIDIKNVDIKAGSWDPSHILSGAVSGIVQGSLNHHIMFGGIARSKTAEYTKQTIPVSLPAGATFVDLKTDSSGLKMYFDLPDHLSDDTIRDMKKKLSTPDTVTPKLANNAQPVLN